MRDSPHGPCFGENVASRCSQKHGLCLPFKLRVQGSGFRVEGFGLQGSGLHSIIAGMRMVWDERGIGMKVAKVVLDEKGFGMKLVLDEIGLG